MVYFRNFLKHFRDFLQHIRAKRKGFLNDGMPDCPASCQSGTGLEKTNDVGISPVTE
jgi:hypothetical protein